MNILIVDDHPIMRHGVRQLIERRWPDVRVDEVETLAAALAHPDTPPGAWDAIVLDLSLPDAAGLEGLTRLRRSVPRVPMLVLSMHNEEAYATRALQLGAAGYLAKERATDELITALERILAGGRYISSALADRLADLLTGASLEKAPHELLSPQEYRVLVLIGAGRPVGEIAQMMHLSVKTISTYRARILEKMALKNTAELTRYCVTNRLSEA